MLFLSQVNLAREDVEEGILIVTLKEVLSTGKVSIVGEVKLKLSDVDLLSKRNIKYQLMARVRQ